MKRQYAVTSETKSITSWALLQNMEDHFFSKVTKCIDKSHSYLKNSENNLKS